MAAAAVALVGRLWTPDVSGAPEMGSLSRRQGEHESSDTGNTALDDVEGGEAAVDLEDDGITSAGPTSATDAPLLPVVVAAEDDDGIDDSSSPSRTNNTSESDRLRRHETVRNLRNLEEERESRRRRTSTCTLIAVFFLFRLWLEALASSDSSLLLVALLLTSWTFRWIQTNRETEEEIDRAIHEYIQRADEEEGGGILSRSAMARASAIENGDLRLMSFQAQLALAILERQVMENGEDNNGEAYEGLDDEAKSRWQRFSYRAELETSAGESSNSGGRTTSTSKGKERDQDAGGQRKKIRFGFPLKRGGYGSVPSLEHPVEEGGDDRGHETCKDAHDIDREPSCSICLCEYEDGDGLARVVPCGHTYHLQCIDAWAESHYRCPLCNYDMRGEAIV